MATRDYKKLYNELKAEHKSTITVNSDIVKNYNSLSMKYKHLDAEFTKAVESNRKYQEQLYEQRGVIKFLEIKIARLIEEMDNGKA